MLVANAVQASLRLPRIAIVTPSFNQGGFLEATLQSVVNQFYPHLHYWVVDGGSHDESGAILQRYRPHLQGLTIEPDRGQYDAINKGFRAALDATNSEVMGWLNSDDLLLPGALHSVGEIFATFPEVEWISCLVRARCSRHGRIDAITHLPGLAREAFSHNRYLPASEPLSAYGFVQQESSFWRRSLWERAGSHVSTRHGLAGDYELWSRFYQYGHCVGLTIPLALNRVHHLQQSADIDRYNADALSLVQPVQPRHQIRLALLRRLRRHGFDRLPSIQKHFAPRFGYRGLRLVLNHPQGPSPSWLLEEHWFL